MGNGSQSGWRGSQQHSGGGGQQYSNPRDGERGGGTDARDNGSGGQRKGSPQGYRDLIVWQKALELVVVVHGLIRRLPEEERLGLGDHLLRAAISVPAHIAAGQGRDPAEFTSSLTLARGGVAELDTLLIVAVELGHLKASDLSQPEELMGAVRALTIRLIQRLRDGPKDRQQGGRPDQRGR